MLRCLLNPPTDITAPLTSVPLGGTFFFNKDYWLKTNRMYDDHSVLCIRLTGVDGHIGDDAGLGVEINVIPVTLQLIKL